MGEKLGRINCQPNLSTDFSALGLDFGPSAGNHFAGFVPAKCCCKPCYGAGCERRFRGGRPIRPLSAGDNPMTTVKIGRDAKTGQFIPVKVAIRRPSTTVVETIKR